jgi:hypothetical protein
VDIKIKPCALWSNHQRDYSNKLWLHVILDQLFSPREIKLRLKKLLVQQSIIEQKTSFSLSFYGVKKMRGTLESIPNSNENWMHFHSTWPTSVHTLTNHIDSSYQFANSCFKIIYLYIHIKKTNNFYYFDKTICVFL